MNYTKASCGHSVIAVGQAGSEVKLKIESEPCERCREFVLRDSQRQKYKDQSPIAFAIYERIESGGRQPGYIEDFGRWSGQVICESCGRQLYDHPPHPFEPCLTITCVGNIVKL